MKIVIAGASGFIGQALVAGLESDGHEVRRLVRTAATGPRTIPWNPAARELDATALHGVDVVVNLAGENIGAGRWTAGRRRGILQSRLSATGTLVDALARLDRPPTVLLSASAVGFYGDRGDVELDEAAPGGDGFLADVCRRWEDEAARAGALGVRVVRARFGVVLAVEGGALARMLPVFRLGLGGRLGSGRQWMSWISRDDAVAALRHLLGGGVEGPVNLVAPAPVTNAEFTRCLAQALRRPAIFPVPAAALRLALGQMADEALLASTRAVPGRLRASGFAFRHPTLGAALAAARLRTG